MIFVHLNLNAPDRRCWCEGLQAPLFEAMRVCRRWLVTAHNTIYRAPGTVGCVLRDFRKSFGLAGCEAQASQHWNIPSTPPIRIISKEEALNRKLSKEIEELREDNRILKYVLAKNKQEW